MKNQTEQTAVEQTPAVFADTVLKVYLNTSGEEYIKEKNLPVTFLSDEKCHEMTLSQIAGFPSDAFRFKHEKSKKSKKSALNKIKLVTCNSRGKNTTFTITEVDYKEKGYRMNYETFNVKIDSVDVICRYRPQQNKKSAVYIKMADGRTYKGNEKFSNYIRKNKKSEINFKIKIKK